MIHAPSRDEHFHRLALAGKGGYLLRAHQLHLIADNAQLLLGGGLVLDGLYVALGGQHALAHHRGQFRLCLHLHGIGGGELAHLPDERLQAVVEILE